MSCKGYYTGKRRCDGSRGARGGRKVSATPTEKHMTGV